MAPRKPPGATATDIRVLALSGHGPGAPPGTAKYVAVIFETLKYVAVAVRENCSIPEGLLRRSSLKKFKIEVEINFLRLETRAMSSFYDKLMQRSRRWLKVFLAFPFFYLLKNPTSVNAIRE